MDSLVSNLVISCYTATIFETTDSIAVARYNGEEVNVYPDPVNKYIQYASDENQLAKFLNNYAKTYVRDNGAKPVTLKWYSAIEGEYTVKVATDSSFSNVVYTEKTTEKTADVYNLIPGITYYYKISNGGIESVVDTFKIYGTTRMIQTFCTNKESGTAFVNMRDVGGYESEFGGTVKYGLAYRSADICNADENGVAVLEQLGIKSEIDLRASSSDGSGKVSPTESITRYNPYILQFDYIFPYDWGNDRNFNATRNANLKTIFEMFADESYYPIVFHCSAGADRTGTVAFLLGAILGVSYEDLVMDFEITSFYNWNRWRSKIVNNDGVYSFDDSGVMQDDDGNLVAFNRMYNHIMTEYGTGDGKLSSATENFLKTVVGVSDETIESIRNILIDGYDS